MLKSFPILLVLLSFYFQEGKAQNNTIDSLSIEDYNKLGVPIINKIWTSRDFAQTIGVLENLKKNGIYTLPRKNGKKSAILFDKLTNIEKYDLLEKNITDFNLKLTFVLETSQSIQKLLLLYYSNVPVVDNKIYFSNEVGGTMISLLFLCEQQIKLLEDFLKNNPNTSDTRKAGIKQVKYGLNSVVAGMLQTIENDFLSYQKLDIILMSDYFFPFYNRINTFLDENARVEFNSKINSIAKMHRYDEVKHLAILK